MRIWRLVVWSAWGIAATSIVSACSSTSAPTPTPDPVPGFTDTTGESPRSAAPYPPGPYGIGVGSVIADHDFIGYPNPKADNAQQKTIRFSDFYNPHAFDKSYAPASPAQDDRLFPADSGYAMAGMAKPTVLLIDVASIWCAPCNQEAKTILPPKHAAYAACGGEFLLDLHDSNNPAIAATLKNLTNWTTAYKVDYPSVIDPSYKLDDLFSAQAYPNNIIIDTTTMKIVQSLAGEVVPMTCSNGLECSADSDCQKCQGWCSDGSAPCVSSGDCFSGSCVGPNSCGDGSTCSTDSDCASKTCTKLPFWTQYEAHLDKSRPGCTL
jgi:hypothetical protein